MGASEIGVFTRAGDLGLRWKHSLTAIYAEGDWSGMLQQLWRAGYKDNVLPGVANGSVVPPNWNPNVSQVRHLQHQRQLHRHQEPGPDVRHQEPAERRPAVLGRLRRQHRRGQLVGASRGRPARPRLHLHGELQVLVTVDSRRPQPGVLPTPPRRGFFSVRGRAQQRDGAGRHVHLGQRRPAAAAGSAGRGPTASRRAPGSAAWADGRPARRRDSRRR